MKKFLTLFICMLCLCAAAARTYTVSEIPNVHLEDSARYVSNPDGILSAGALREADNLMRDIRRTTSAEAVMVVVDDIEGGDIDTFATELFEEWGLGKSDKDNGLLVLVATDLRRAVIRTGYGLEGVLPDIVCAKILKDKMFPAFKRGDYDEGILAAAGTIDKILSDPDYRDEILSGEADADFADDDDLGSFFAGYFIVAGIITLVMLFLLGMALYSSRGKSNHNRYMALKGLKPVYLALTFFGLGLPALASVPLLLFMSRFRNKPRKCPRCGTAMIKVDEVHDNEYLSAAQDTEERIGSVDYDVWLCPSCGETDIEPYVNPNSGFVKCPECGGLTASLLRERILVKPTTARNGSGIKEYRCANCGHIHGIPFEIPMLSSAAAPVIIGGLGSRHGGGGGFGGGSFGGGFGGGMTGGGGASGGW